VIPRVVAGDRRIVADNLINIAGCSPRASLPRKARAMRLEHRSNGRQLNCSNSKRYKLEQ